MAQSAKSIELGYIIYIKPLARPPLTRGEEDEQGFPNKGGKKS
jgi:hypothetical protein